MTPYAWTIVILALIGVVPGLWFSLSWWRRVPHPFGWAAFDAGGWVVAFTVIYAYTIVGYVTGEFTTPPSRWQAAGRIALSIVITTLIIARVIRWRLLSRDYRRAGKHVREDVPER